MNSTWRPVASESCPATSPWVTASGPVEGVASARHGPLSAEHGGDRRTDVARVDHRDPGCPAGAGSRPWSATWPAAASRFDMKKLERRTTEETPEAQRCCSMRACQCQKATGDPGSATIRRA